MAVGAARPLVGSLYWDVCVVSAANMCDCGEFEMTRRSEDKGGAAPGLVQMQDRVDIAVGPSPSVIKRVVSYKLINDQ